MMEIPASGRPVILAEHRPPPPGGDDADLRMMRDAGPHMPPVMPPPEAERASLQPMPVPERQIELLIAAQDETVDDSSDDSTVESAAVADFDLLTSSPSRMAPSSMFQGLISEAAMSNSTPPGRVMEIYSLVKKLASLMQPVDVQAA